MKERREGRKEGSTKKGKINERTKKASLMTRDKCFPVYYIESNLYESNSLIF